VNDPVHEGMHLTMITVTNAGRRPVTVPNVGLMCVYHRGAIFTDSIPHIYPSEIDALAFLTDHLHLC
jgi:hypothetical protein